MAFINMLEYYKQDGDRTGGNTISNFKENVLPIVLQHLNGNRCALDVGCGNGRMAKILSEHFINVVAIDQCNVFDERFKAKNITFNNVDFKEFKTNEKFDLIMLWAMFYMIGEQKESDFLECLEKCSNLLSPKGIIVIGDDVKRRIEKNPGKKGTLYNISQLCKQTGLNEIIDFTKHLRVTILNKNS